MRSRHVDHFNHDTEVDGYDDDVADESNPVRNGYDATLDWVIEHAAVGRDDVVVDLGTGTGNLAARLGPRAPGVRRRVDRHARGREDQAAAGDRVRRRRSPRVPRCRTRVRRGDEHLRDPPPDRRREDRPARRPVLAPTPRRPHRDRRLDGCRPRSVAGLRDSRTRTSKRCSPTSSRGSSTTVAATWRRSVSTVSVPSRPACCRGDCPR